MHVGIGIYWFPGSIEVELFAFALTSVSDKDTFIIYVGISTLTATTNFKPELVSIIFYPSILVNNKLIVEVLVLYVLLVMMEFKMD